VQPATSGETRRIRVLSVAGAVLVVAVAIWAWATPPLSSRTGDGSQAPATPGSASAESRLQFARELDDAMQHAASSQTEPTLVMHARAAGADDTELQFTGNFSAASARAVYGEGKVLDPAKLRLLGFRTVRFAGAGGAAVVFPLDSTGDAGTLSTGGLPAGPDDIMRRGRISETNLVWGPWKTASSMGLLSLTLGTDGRGMASVEGPDGTELGTDVDWRIIAHPETATSPETTNRFWLCLLYRGQLPASDDWPPLVGGPGWACFDPTYWVDRSSSLTGPTVVMNLGGTRWERHQLGP
jgi:hypothetical protein